MTQETELSSDALKELKRLADALVAAEKAVEDAEQALKDAKRNERHLREQEVPDFMQELGIAELKLETGEKISYKADVRLEWNDAQKGAAFGWLEKNNFGGLIKTVVGAEFGKGELERAKELLARLTEEGLPAAMKRDVHYQTMCAFLRERIEAGDAIPLEEWGAVSINKASVSMPRKRKGTT